MAVVVAVSGAYAERVNGSNAVTGEFAAAFVVVALLTTLGITAATALLKRRSATSTANR